MEYDFSTELPEELLGLLMEAGGALGVDPLSSPESESYFSRLLSGYSGSLEGLGDYLTQAVARDFRAMGERPRWMQAAEWPFHNGRPMVFVGQLDAAVRRDGFSYWTAFYVFWDPEDGAARTVTQSD